jgi:beta-glucosidase
LAAIFDPIFMETIATAISDEARAKHHESARKNDFGQYKGLTFWTPNINIFRDPRWGRGQETYGEDPYLTARLGVAFVKGLQGNDPKYLKVVATPKHYIVHSGPEHERHRFNAVVNQQDLYDTYVPAFKACVVEAGAFSVMGAYNRTNGELCCASPTYLQKLLREEWGFEGYVVSDCGAISDFHKHHKITKNVVESVAMAVNEGCDLNCGYIYRHLGKAVEQGLITEDKIALSVKRLMLARMKLGMFDSPDAVPYTKIPFSKNDCKEHRELALKAAEKSMVLLKNLDDFLPVVDPNKYKKIAVIGPNSDSLDVLLGNYEGKPSKYATALTGIKNSFPKSIEIKFSKGCKLIKKSKKELKLALEYAKNSDLIIACMGVSPKIEGEQGSVISKKGDRTELDMPKIQRDLLKQLNDLNKPIILVLFSGSPICNEWMHNASNVKAILEAWYPGEEGGNAIANILLGKVSPSGRLPITFVKTLNDLPPIRDYNMKGRTYRYFDKEPLYPFGYGLSYTTFEYSNLKIDNSSIKMGENLKVTVSVQNKGKCGGEEVVQLYIKDIDASERTPKYSLRGVRRIYLESGRNKVVEFKITPRDMALITKSGKCIVEPGMFKILVGGRQPNSISEKLSSSVVLNINFEVSGEILDLD